MSDAGSLRRQLAALGVHPGDTLMVHASMRAVGGRAEELLAALQASVEPEGHLLMLICSPAGAPFVGDASPAWSELGVLAEVFRRSPGVVLNRHPIARFGAWGPDASALVESPPLHDYYGPGSPLDRLLTWDGRVLRLGADEDSVTLLHHAEYLAEVPDKRRTTHTALVLQHGIARTVQVGCLDDSEGIRDRPGEDYFALILKAFLAAGGARVGPVGGATAELLDAPELVDFGVRWMEGEWG